MLRLARVNPCVKCVAPQAASWDANNGLARPQYTTSNVVAFAQDPDGPVRLSCVESAELSKDFHIQLEGACDSVVKHDGALQVNLTRLGSRGR